MKWFSLNSIVFISALLIGSVTRSEELRGHIKYALSQSDLQSGDILELAGIERERLQRFEGRVHYLDEVGGVQFELDPEILVVGGNSIDERRTLPYGELLPKDSRQLFDLTLRDDNSSDAEFAARLDRLNLQFGSEQVTTTIGRQANSWGNGLVFQILDLFNPFSPVAIDKEYKAGDDMLSMRGIFSDDSDIQLLIVPRRELDSHDVEEDQSSFALKYRRAVDQIDIDIVASRHLGQELAGIGFSRNVLEAVLRSDLIVRGSEDGTKTSFLVNIDRAFTACARNLYLYVEYLYNDFGVSDPSMIDQEVRDLLDRGELYTTMRNYLSVGGRFEIGPRSNLYANQIFNLDDQSGFSQVRLEVDLMQDRVLLIGANLPYGGRGSEYGGVALLGTPGYAAPAATIYTRIAAYF